MAHGVRHAEEVNMNLQIAEFVTSVTDLSKLPKDGLPQIVFSGKSNVGKSSVINRVLNRKNFARVGETPGKTVHIYFFRIDNRAYFVDLPGYGYAKVPKAEKERWGKLMEQYFSVPERVSLGIQIVDARHKPTADDVTMCAYFQSTGRPFAVVANKLDKLKKSELEPNLALIRQTLALDEATKLIPFSAEKGTGRDELVREIFAAAGE
jgi:GTP-binding protein